MKKYFYLMSIMFCMIIGSMAFVACGDDDDDNGTGVITEGKYAGNRLIGEWIWGEPDMPQHEEGHHAAGYIFNANGTCTHYNRDSWDDQVFEDIEKGTFVLDGLKLTITWTTRIMKEHGETFEDTMEDPEIDECEIMYPEEGNVGMFIKRYYDAGGGRQGWNEEGPFYKK
ncbi:hypothetical protein [Xylanibacter brevis]|uniref:hypothetical protein n=1 Tax=Xylanibacter brevis TaxID=83231 RepID=UPI0012DF5F82|nr:hypothetical protein [Xylanibacter brevis]